MMNRFQKPLQQTVTILSLALRQQSTSIAPAVGPVKIGRPSEEVFQREDKYGAHNYHPLPVAIQRGKGENP